MLDAKTVNRSAPESGRTQAHAWDSGEALGAKSGHVGSSAPSLHHNMPVSQVMTASVVTFSADTTIEQATKVLLDRGISGAPVVDETQHPTGMVSKTDLLEAWQQRALARDQGTADAVDSEVRVGDIMVPYLLAISHRAPISLATALMAYEGVHRLVVLGENNKMVGIVTSLDIVRWVAGVSGFQLSRTTRLQRA